MCFQHQCVVRKAIKCPAGAACPPTYWRMFWYLDKLCHDRFTPEMLDMLRAGRPKGESTPEDLKYLAAFSEALQGAEIRDADVHRFYYDPHAGDWLPHPCTDNVKRWVGKPLPESTLRWRRELLKLVGDPQRP